MSARIRASPARPASSPRSTTARTTRRPRATTPDARPARCGSSPGRPKDLAARRLVHRHWAEGSFGLMGRTPDHVASLITAFAAAARFRSGRGPFGDNVVAFYEGARGRLVHRLRDHAAAGRPVQAGPPPARAVPVPRDRRGARRGHRHPRGADDRDVGGHRRLALPELDRAAAAGRRGLRDLGGDAAERGGPSHLPAPAVLASPTTTVRLSAVLALRRSDSLIVLDDVLVPWEHVFVHRDIGLVSAQFHETGAHLLANYQALVRFLVKMEFASGLAIELADAHGISAIPPVQAQIGGDIAAFCSALDRSSSARSSARRSGAT